MAELLPKAVVELAVLGGEPAFHEPLHVGRPNLGSRARFLARVGDLLDRGWLTNDGPLVQEFEARVAEMTGARNAVAVCNATVALELVARALELRGEVIVPSFTFVATAHAMTWLGLRPVFADVDAATHTLSPESVERRITPETSAILGVHVWGRACAVDELSALAEQQDLVLVFDAAHALGCQRKGVPIGRFGRAEILSFHATKVCNSFEGGMIVTDDDVLAQKLRLMRNFGFGGRDRVVALGTNAKLTEIAAAMGLTTLEALPETVAVNVGHHRRYRELLSDLPGVRVVEYDPADENHHHYVVVEVDADRAGLTRDEFVTVLQAENCLARRYFHPGVHRMEPYRTLEPDAARHLPVTERLTESVMTLPTGTGVERWEVEHVCRLVSEASRRASDVRAALARAPRH